MGETNDLQRWLKLGNLPSYYEALAELYTQKSLNSQDPETKSEHRGASRGYTVAASTLRDILEVPKMRRKA